MRLRILCGRAASGKSQHCIHEMYERSKTDNGRSVLIVPEQFCFNSEKKLVETIGAASGATAEALTFSRLAHRIFAVCGGNAKKTLSAAGKNMLVSRALYLKKNELNIFKKAGDKAGFGEKSADLISEFKRYGISPEMLLETADKALSPVLSAKLRDLALIYEKYEQLFLKGYIDADDNLYRAAALLGDCDILDGAHVFIDEFADFLPQHYAMIEAICKKADSVTITLCAEQGSELDGFFAPSARTLVRLKQLCAEANIKFEKIEYLDGNSGFNSKEIAFLEKNYTRYSPDVYQGKTSDITLFCAKNIFSEIHNCAREIKRLLRDSDLRYRDIAIACSEESYFSFIESLFSMYDIDVFVGSKTTADMHPCVLTLLCALDVFIYNYSYESVFAYLKSPYSNLSDEETDELENYVLASGVKGKKWLDEEDWKYRSGVGEELDETEAEKEAERLCRIDRIRRKAIAPLVELRKNLGSKNTVKTAGKAIFEFLCALDMPEKIRLRMEDFTKMGEFEAANEYARVWNVIMEILDQAVLLAGSEKLGLIAFRQFLAAGFSKHETGIIPQNVDKITVCDISNARACSVKALFILGANSTNFPSYSTVQGVLNDADRQEMINLGIEVAPTTRQKAFDERFVIYRVLSKPTHKLYISHAIADAEGKSLVPSVVLDNIAKIFPDITRSDDLQSVEDERTLVTTPLATAYELAVHMHDNENKQLWESALAWYKESPHYRNLYNLILAAKYNKNEAKTIDSELMSRLYPGDINTSISRMEQYAKCPYSYFIAYALNAKERKILKIGAPDIGNIMHEVLELFVSRVKEEGLGWKQLDEQWCMDAATDIIDGIIYKLLKDSLLQSKSVEFLLKRLKENLLRCVMLVVEHISRGEFEPVGCEVKFGDDGELKGVAVDLYNGKKIKIHGIIDRLDKYEADDGTYYRVIDYKSGSKTFSLSDIYNKLDFQLFVYLDAVSSASKNAKKAGVLYFKIAEPMIKSDSRLSVEESEKALYKEMCLDGMLLADKTIISKMDNLFSDKPSVLPVKIKKDGEFDSRSKVATMQQFEKLTEYVRDNLRQIGRSILAGKVDISPCREKDKGVCDYCKFKDICKFDLSYEANAYRKMKSYKFADVLEMVDEM